MARIERIGADLRARLLNRGRTAYDGLESSNRSLQQDLVSRVRSDPERNGGPAAKLALRKG
jgi:hypothetical protein